MKKNFFKDWQGGFTYTQVIMSFPYTSSDSFIQQFDFHNCQCITSTIYIFNYR